MQINESDLVRKYSEMEDSELMNLFKKDSLTEEAREILSKEIRKRNIDINKLLNADAKPKASSARKIKSRIKSAIYGFISGLFIGSSVLSSAISNYNPTLISEVFIRSAIGIFIGLILFFISIFISEKTAKIQLITCAVIFSGYFIIKSLI